ncbi:MAG: TrpR-like protein [Oscillospiraceae bacterium]|nr:TrpR-like protein [Oscillospiraceae bacterium]
MPRIVKRERSTAMYETILKLETLDECVQFFEDLCAATELSALEQRFEVASLLLQGKVYTEVMDATKASSATVSRVNRMLNYGHGKLGEVIARGAEQKE